MMMIMIEMYKNNFIIFPLKKNTSSLLLLFKNPIKRVIIFNKKKYKITYEMFVLRLEVKIYMMCSSAL